MKLIHAADLHIDSPMIGASRYEGAPALRGATRKAFSALVDLCLVEGASFLVLAGDVFDDDWRDMNTGLFFLAELRRLREVGTQVVLVRGNHDFQITSALTWPSFLHELPPGGSMLPFADMGIVFHGASFPTRHHQESLLPRLGPAVTSLCNIGVLHTNATQSREHGDYAPCTVSELVDKGYDYFALGHVHTRAVLHGAPNWVVYPGNLQGRRHTEAGPRGCMVVDIDDTEVRDVRFEDVSVVRWFDESVELSADDDLDELFERANARLREVVAASEGRLASVRLTVRGAAVAHREVVDRAHYVVSQVRANASELSDALLLGDVRLDTTPAAGIEALRAAQGLVADMLREIDRLRADEADLSALVHALGPIAGKAGDAVDLGDSGFVARALDGAEALLAQRLTEGEG